MIQQMVNQTLRSNPLFQRAQQMAQGKSEEELKQIANIIGQLRPTPTPAYLTCSPYESNMYATRGLYGTYGNGCGCNSCC